ncbi:uracil phosphoribosyltransferase [Lipingzhangella sp. LS1_29]|uniref:Uracil phosphoribosyltransferase n=1 Tax=Lipingzhangella rawalii TaxID=2055835 RepID=A0ABU2H800_9ACTN|nr:uracil phosphoribosyltransferase [Lipingzhangella rawalii]MDS1271441.1 uracil phosphoribosyltransferase [Lipingzhangella rawalii]
METLVIDHPLVSHKLTVLRESSTDSPTFRRLTDELVTLLTYEATRDVRVADVTITTPLAPAAGVQLTDPAPLVVPILRAGLGMLEGMTRLLPTAEVGFLGMARDEQTLQPATYADRLPADLSGRQCYVLDPMLATGGTLAASLQLLLDRGADQVTAICLLAAPEGLQALDRKLAADPAHQSHPRVRVVTAAVDDRLDENGFILPGLGDAGDRLYGSM